MTNKKISTNKDNRPILLWGSILILVIVFVSVWISQQNPTLLSTQSEISVAKAAEKREQGAFILDVRTVEEWEEVHIPGSTLIPRHELPSRLAEVPEEMEIVVVCRSGNRSQEGRDILLDAGYEQVSSMRGGINEWEARGYPIESEP
jgi:rhodanese-related sulfurtransferase